MYTQAYDVTVNVLLCCAAVSLAERVVDRPVVQITTGPIQGESLEYPAGRLSRYLGVPYGRPPVGPLRFTAPQTPEPWTETLTTTAYPHRCYQTSRNEDLFWLWDYLLPISEDCLYLNVYAPHGSEKEKKAVMVWIHGGKLTNGAASDYPLEALTLAGDVIGVSINYRLDIFGFLATEDASVPGNAGFLDQVLALRWVQDNIAVFGGDPDKVTIFGESAGGWSVNAHMVSPLSRGLFTRAISQSGSLYGYLLETREERAERTRGLAASLDCPSTPKADMLTCLQTIPADTLLHNSTHDGFLQTGGISAATAGGDFFPEQPSALWDQHHIAPGVDYMLGVNSDEGLVMLYGYPTDHGNLLLHSGVGPGDPVFEFLLESTALRYPKHANLTSLIPELVRDQYLPNLGDKLAVMRGLLDLVADGFFVAPSLGAVERMAETDSKVYLYYFDHLPTSHWDNNYPVFSGAPEVAIRADHGFELFYMFACPFVEEVPCSWVHTTTSEDEAISRSIVHTMTNFAKTGRMTVLLNDGSEMDWPQYNKSSKAYLEWKYPMTSASAKSRLRPRADNFWNVLVPAVLLQRREEGPNTRAMNNDEL